MPSASAGPIWTVRGLAVVGALVAGYLTWTKLTGGPPVCAGGDGCAVVQASRYAELLSAPTAAWGLAFYLLVGGLARRGAKPSRWWVLFEVAVAGVAFSGLLTAIALLRLRAACLLCLVSAGIACALLGAVLWQHRASSALRTRVRVSRLVAWGAATAMVTVAGAATLFAFDPAASAPRQIALAAHLRRSGAVMYGAFWCPVCREQKARFGPAATDLPYVECDPRGLDAHPDQCARVGVQGYPTWIVGGARREGLLTLDELDALSGFVPPASGPGPPGG